MKSLSTALDSAGVGGKSASVGAFCVIAGEKSVGVEAFSVGVGEKNVGVGALPSSSAYKAPADREIDVAFNVRSAGDGEKSVSDDGKNVGAEAFCVDADP